MIEFSVALDKAKKQAYPLTVDLIHFGETKDKFVFFPKNSLGTTPLGGGAITVGKKSGECKYEYLERTGSDPSTSLKNYRALSLDEILIKEVQMRR